MNLFGCKSLVFLIVAPAVVQMLPDSASAVVNVRPVGAVELEVKSKYSHIRVRRRGAIRQLTFIRDNGDEVVETMMNRSKPGDLLVPYTQYMFASYLFKPKHQRVLIVGLGGGSMVHFLKRRDPQVKVDALEIDPKVVEIADKYFDTRSGGNVKVLTADGFEYLAETEQRYDVIYMDAFLKPSAETDEIGAPLRLKTIEFYKSLHKKLTADGQVVFNLNAHAKLAEDIEVIRRGFPQVYVFRITNLSYVAVATMTEPRADPAKLRTAARAADRRLRANFSFQRMVGKLVQDK